MKFVISSAALLQQVQQLMKVAPENHVLPILECIQFDIQKREFSYHLVLYATDLELTMSAKIDIEAKQACRVAVPGKLLLDVLKTFPEQPLTFSINENTFAVEIVSDRGRCKLPGINGDDFPKYPVLQDETPRIEFPQQALAEGIRQNLFAVGDDGLRPVLTGMLVQVEKNRLTMVATEAHKLSRYIRTDFTSATEASFILPKKALEIFRKYNAAFDNSYCALQGNTFFFCCNNVMLATRVIEGKYPDYKAVIPTECTGKVVFTGTLLESLNRVMLFATKSTKQVVLNITGGVITLSSEDFMVPDTEASEKVYCEYDGPDMEIAFNGTYLKEALQAVGCEGVMELLRPTTATIFRPAEQIPHTDYLCLVMPILFNK